ncbi:MAG: biopolymer transporter ExbD [Pseudomonadota bacterium]
MRGRKFKLSDEATVDLTPMLDVVFILLIFFIVTSTFIQEDAIALEPPPPACPNCPTPETQAILIYVDARNTVRIGGDLYDISAARSGIERRRAESPDAAVIIQAHPEAHTGTIILLRDAVYDAKVERVNIVRSS